MELKLPEQTGVIGITMRNGPQNEEHYVPLEVKLYLADRLIKTGFKRLEVGSISHVAYMPQFEDVDELLLKPSKDADVEHTVLALAPKAIEWMGGLLNRGTKISRVFTDQITTSEAYVAKNIRRTHQQLFDEAEKSVKALHDMGIKRMAGNIGTVFNCPTQGKVSTEQVYKSADHTFDIGFGEVEHSGSDGIATPRDIVGYFRVILEKHSDPARRSFHIHDTRGMGIAGYYTVTLAGTRTSGCTVGDTGGQATNFLDGVPVKSAGDYYFDTCRIGLVSTGDFITMVNDMGIYTGVGQERLYALGHNLEKMPGCPLYPLTGTARSGLRA